MELQLIRSATMRLHYGGQQLVLDPFLAAKESIRSFAGKSENPLVDLPMTPEAVVAGADAAVISHLHIDHFDPLAQELLAKDIPVFCQPGDEAAIVEHGFKDVIPVEEEVQWAGLSLTRTPGQHGTGEWAERMGKVSGFVFRASGEPVLYWAGDTIWYQPVEETVQRSQPDIIITHSSGAKFGDSDPIVMDAAQTIELCLAAPQATVIAVHLESLDHGTVSRAGLRTLAETEGIGAGRLLIPADGQTLSF